MKIKELAEKLDNEIIQKKNQESYDNCGLIVGSGENEIAGILTTLDINEDVVLEAEKLGCNLIVAHHPIIFFAIKSMVDSNPNQKTIMLAISKGISIYAAHTSLDNRFFAGINESLAEKMGLENIQPLKAINPDVKVGKESEMGAGAIGNLSKPEFVVDFLCKLKKTLNLSGAIRYSNFNEKAEITKVALCSGAGLFMAQEAKKQGAELFITSDITYHGFFDEKGIILADIGHFDSEKHASEVIAKLLRCFAISPEELSPEKIFISNVNTNPASSIL
jgi:dinuclear metal center YbgI/SA1388 family protein